jgi:3-hydroxyisobutyrate dehydrogenase
MKHESGNEMPAPAKARSVAMLGLGAMGEPMARHLHARGLLSGVYNRSHDKAEGLAAECAVSAFATPVEAAQRSEVVLLCVSADADVLSVFEALKPGLRPGMLVIDTSTVSQATAQSLGDACAKLGVQFLDAPLTGGVEGARLGKLSIMLGGDQAAVERARPVLECFAARITHMGPIGAGQATKAVNQVMVAGIAQAVSEALAFAEKLGLPAAQLLNVLTGGAAQSWFLEKRGPTMLKNEFAGGFKLALLLKDLRIVEGMLKQQNLQSSVVQRSLVDYAELVKRGMGDAEISALITLKRDSQKH